MSGEPKLVLPPETARLLTDGINKAHEELKDLGSIGDATAGTGFQDLALSAVELGHHGLADGFRTFCERWGWGVRTLMQRGNGFAQAVGLAAGGLHELDQYVDGTFKIVVNGVNGNPHLSEEEVKAKSWDELRSQSPTDGADWSGASFSKAHEDVTQTWNDVNYDIQHQLADSMERAGVYDSRERELLDQAQQAQYKPTDEAVQRAKGSSTGAAD
ncbi:hypothetical protein [Streptomyces sp. TRM64462]|uniref:hypothetical protein n=1 Tax=Streptomyces sp. TRM64462 TaxID=2741726 RepID=UPI001586360E|nr:hypothetical protein [Streptomyces sp. TRM64462]